MIPPHLFAEYINKNFATIGSKLASELPAADPLVIPPPIRHNDNDIMHPLSYLGVIRSIMSIKINKPSSI